MDEVEGEAVVIVDDEDHGALLPVTRHDRKPNRFARGGEDGAGLGLAFALVVCGVPVGDAAGAGLHVHFAVLYDRAASHAETVHIAAGAKISDADRIGAAS